MSSSVQFSRVKYIHFVVQIVFLWCLTNTRRSSDSAILLLGTYPREKTTYVIIKMWTQEFIAALSIVVNNWEQRKCPSARDWINIGTSVQWNTTKW